MNTVQHTLQQGWAIHQQQRFAEAESIYRDVLKRAPSSANAWCYLGIALHDQRLYQAAVDAYQRALALQPEFPIALNNLGNSLRYVRRIEEADACFQKAIDLKPDYVNAYKNRGTLHVWNGGLERGLACYEQAMKLNPNDAELHRNLGVIYLLQGRFEEGWREYRWRWRVGDLHRPKLSAPVWDGSDPQGKTLLLSAEQGLGDTIHFVRLARLLRQRGTKTVVYCQPQLLALLQNSPDLGAIYPNSLKLEQSIDWHCSLLDVADLLELDAQSIPSQVPYIQPAAHLTRYWSSRFSRTPSIRRVGIAWQGNPDQQADMYRSIPLSYFEPLASVPRVELVSLQQGHGCEQLQNWKGAHPITVFDSNFDQSSGAFMDSAAVIKQLDLVITCDTAIGHLAGSMAVPTWIALGYTPDWRWLLHRDDSPWYPTVRLFRQASIGDWSSVFKLIVSQLDAMTQKPLS